MKTSTFDLSLIFIGLILMTIGLFRTFPPRVDQRFLWSVAPMVIAFIAAFLLAAYAGGMKYIMAGTDATVAVTSSFLITLVLLMPVIGLSAPLAHHFEKDIGNALTGPLGYFWAVITAFLAPGGNALSGVVSKLWSSNQALRPVLLYFMSVVPLTSFTIFYIRQLGLGSEISWIMYKANWFISICLVPCFWIYGKFL